MSRRRVRLAVVLAACALQGCALIARQGTIVYLDVTTGSKDIEIQLHNSFVERYMDRVTMTTSFTVDEAMSSPYPAMFDGDMHFSGRAPQIGLPAVGEIANAASHKDAIAIVDRAEATKQSLNLTGVWRIWPEHSGSAKEVQGKPVAPTESTNPKHVFEIHPVTRLDGMELLDSFTPVNGFKPGDARRTFGIYEKATCTLKVHRETVSILAPQGLYNDVEFSMELVEDEQHVVSDGRFVVAAVRDLKGDLLVERRRMAFVSGTPPELAVKRLKRGDRLHVYGMPRIDLAEVSRRMRDAAANPARLTESLPYEIVILGVFDR